MRSAQNKERLLSSPIKQILFTEEAFGIGEPWVELPSTGRVESEDKANRLRTLYDCKKNCDLCSLSKTRTHFVFGSGSPSAALMFVGEAPGFDEDRQGLPFVGAAGQLLTKIIQAMNLTREDVYIANCLKCRPPENRNPLPDEIVSCAPILLEQIRIIRPKVICALGKFAAQTLLRSEEPISRLRGRFFDFENTKLIPTFHPAYLLRNPADKKLVWEDMKKIMGELERSLN